MNTQDILQATENQSHFDFSEQVLAVCTEMEKACAETLLDQVEEAQAQIQGLIDDISLLQTAENALDLIAENLSKIRRLASIKQRGNLSHYEETEINDSINNLMMVTMLVTEDAEFNGHRLFADDVILLNGTGSGRVFLATSHLPQIRGIETNDAEAVLDSLGSVACVINRQYQRIGTALHSLLCDYRQLRKEIDMIIISQSQQTQ